MAIRFDRPTSEELMEDLEISQEALTICKVRYQRSGNTLFLRIPYVFPDYNNLHPKQTIYFLDLNNTIYLCLTEPKIKNYTSRKIQWYGNGSGSKYIRVPLPIQLRKKYNLDIAQTAHLIKRETNYECIFI